MRNHTRNRIGSLIATFAIGTMVVLLHAGTAGAATLVFDDFDGSSSTNLVGTTADVGGVWTGAANDLMKADGSITGGTKVAYQAVTIATGEVYMLSADVTLTDTGAHFIAIGFADSAGDGDGNIWVDTNPSAWIYLNHSAFGIRRLTGPNLAGEVQIEDTVFDTPVNLKVMLDTTNPLDFEATWFVNGVEEDSAFIGAPSLTHVFINNHAGTIGSVDNFLLTEGAAAIPAPAALPAGLAMLGLVVMRRRMK